MASEDNLAGREGKKGWRLSCIFKENTAKCFQNVTQKCHQEIYKQTHNTMEDNSKNKRAKHNTRLGMFTPEHYLGNV